MNVPAQAQTKSAGASDPAALEAISAVCPKVVSLWGTRELDAFISHLIMDSRDGKRRGLPLAAAEELIFLAENNKIVRAMETQQTLKISYDEAYKMICDGDDARFGSDVWGQAGVGAEGSRGSHDNLGMRRVKARPQRRASSGGSMILLLLLAIGLGYYYWNFIRVPGG